MTTWTTLAADTNGRRRTNAFENALRRYPAAAPPRSALAAPIRSAPFRFALGFVVVVLFSLATSSFNPVTYTAPISRAPISRMTLAKGPLLLSLVILGVLLGAGSVSGTKWLAGDQCCQGCTSYVSSW